jgi:CheY-like chemotaxis protein
MIQAVENSDKTPGFGFNDIKMPNMDGYEAARIIRDQIQIPNIAQTAMP